MRLYQKIALIGTAIASIIVGGYLINRNSLPVHQNQFQDSAYHYLVDDFTAKRLRNTESPLFDFNDPTIQEVYDKAKGTAVANVIPRDIQSNKDIVNAVSRHLSQYGNISLIIISGAGCHIWGATPTLEDRFDAEYISITPKKLNLGNVMNSGDYSGNKTEPERIEKAKKSVSVQLIRDLGVVRHMGYRNLEDYMKNISNFDGAKNIVVGMEETGLHEQYSNQDTKLIYQTLSSFIEQFKPKSILYIGEDLFSENMRRDFDNGTLTQTDFLTGEPYYQTQFLNRARGLNISVEFASFGRQRTPSLTDRLKLFRI